MTSPYYYATASSADLAALSRRKLQSVVPESGDTLRRCVLIHNIMRSTASYAYHTSHNHSTEPITPPPSPTDDHPTPATYYDEEEEEPTMEEEEEQAYREATSASPSFRGRNEQDWLDSILNDLGASDYQYAVSVVDADQDEEMLDTSATPTTTQSASECEQQATPTAWHPPLFPTPHLASPPASPPLHPTSPRCIPIPDVDDCTFCAIDNSPPTSPPGLEADDMDSDEDDEDEEYHYGMMDSSSEEELRTPSASTEFPQTIGMAAETSPADLVLFSNLPFNRLRPVTCDNHAPTY